MKFIRCLWVLCFFTFSLHGFAQINSKTKRQVYFTWGYNKDYFTKSNIHFYTKTNAYNFKIFDAVAHDRPGYEYIAKSIQELTVPQYQIRIGRYFINKPNDGIELNFDHTKYVMDDNQTLHLNGTIHGRFIDKDTLIMHSFIHFEHTNGANFLLLNYFKTKKILSAKKFSIEIFAKAGVGIVVPKTDVTLFGTRLDNYFHVAGFLFGTETDIRFKFFNHFYLEAGAKTCFADYLNALCIKQGKVNHSFGSFEWLACFGYQIGI